MQYTYYLFCGFFKAEITLMIQFFQLLFPKVTCPFIQIVIITSLFSILYAILAHFVFISYYTVALITRVLSYLLFNLLKYAYLLQCLIRQKHRETPVIKGLIFIAPVVGAGDPTVYSTDLPTFSRGRSSPLLRRGGKN